MLETIDNEVYTSLAQYRMDICSPQAKVPEIRRAFERKLERSYEAIRHTSTQTAVGKRQVFARSHIDANGQRQIKVSDSYMPERSAELAESQGKGSTSVLPGGVVRVSTGVSNLANKRAKK